MWVSSLEIWGSGTSMHCFARSRTVWKKSDTSAWASKLKTIRRKKIEEEDKLKATQNKG
jgi:hypothetical protein